MLTDLVGEDLKDDGEVRVSEMKRSCGQGNPADDPGLVSLGCDVLAASVRGPARPRGRTLDERRPSRAERRRGNNFGTLEGGRATRRGRLNSAAADNSRGATQA